MCSLRRAHAGPFRGPSDLDRGRRDVDPGLSDVERIGEVSMMPHRDNASLPHRSKHLPRKNRVLETRRPNRALLFAILGSVVGRNPSAVQSTDAPGNGARRRPVDGQTEMADVRSADQPHTLSHPVPLDEFEQQML